MGMHNCPDIIKVEALDDYILRVTFADGVIKEKILTGLLSHGVFQRLKNMDFFKKAHADHGAVVWDDNLDCAPEYFYDD